VTGTKTEALLPAGESRIVNEGSFAGVEAELGRMVSPKEDTVSAKTLSENLKK
jgi:hypothetical protein